MKLNSKTRKTGDWIQSKYQFRCKIQKIVDVPKTYFYGTDLIKIRRNLTKHNEFVMKPNHLSRGIGIRVLKRDGDFWIDINGEKLTLKDLVDECAVMMRVKRYKGVKAILIEEKINTHPKLNPNGFADMRFIYYYDRFLWCTGRFGNKSSKGYGNTNRGATFGSYIAGKHVSDSRFITSGKVPKEIPFFDEMVLTGQKVSKLFGYVFMSVDMTVDCQGKIKVIESEQMPQIQYYLTDFGVDWINKIIGKNKKIDPNPIKIKKSTKGLSSYFPIKVRKAK